MVNVIKFKLNIYNSSDMIFTPEARIYDDEE